MVVKDNSMVMIRKKNTKKSTQASNKKIELRKHDVVNSPTLGVKCVKTPFPFRRHSSDLFDLREIYLNGHFNIIPFETTTGYVINALRRDGFVNRESLWISANTSKTHTWGVEHLKNMLVKMGSSSPSFPAAKHPKTLSNHHLGS